MTDNHFKIALRAAALSFALAPAATAVALADPPGYLFHDINPQPMVQPALSAVSRGNHWEEMARNGNNGHVEAQSNATSAGTNANM